MDTLDTSREHGTADVRPRLHLLLFGAILATYVLIAWQSIHAPFFVQDDAAELAYIRSHPSPGSLFQYDSYLFFRPVKNLCFLGINGLLPLGLAPCRMLVIAIGLCSAVTVHVLFRRLLGGAIAALAATACWLLAPTLVSCTAWLSCVNIQAMAGFAAGALLLYLGSCMRTGAAAGVRLAGAWMSALLAMLCYEGAVCLPALVVLIDFFRYPERMRQRRTWRAYGLLAMALLLYLLLRVSRTGTAHVQSDNFGEMPDWQVVFAAPWFLWQHLSIWLWPFGRQAVLGVYLPGQVASWLLGCAWTGLIVLVSGCLLLRRRFAFVSLGVAWLLTAFLPMSNVLAFRNGPYGDYYLALASMGLALAAGWGVGELAARGRRARAARLALVAMAVWRLSAAGESFIWSAAWNEPEVLFEHTLGTFPQAFGAWNEYARLRYQRGAYEDCQALTDQAIALAPHARDAYGLRALVAERRGNVDLARKELGQFMKYGGAGESWGWYFQGYLLASHAGDTNGAIRAYEQALANRKGWSPDVLDAMTSLGFFAVQRGDRRGAVALWEQVVMIDPQRTRVRQNLVRAYAELGETDLARQHLRVLRP